MAAITSRAIPFDMSHTNSLWTCGGTSSDASDDRKLGDDSFDQLRYRQKKSRNTISVKFLSIFFHSDSGLLN